MFNRFFIYIGRGAGKNGYLGFNSFFMMTGHHGIKRYDIDIVATSQDQAKTSAVGNFLYGLNLIRKQSRMRRRLINLLIDRNKIYLEDRKELQEEHANKDDEGKAIIIDGDYDIEDMVAFSNDLKELNEEKLVIEGSDNREMIRTIQEVLKKFEDEEYEGAEVGNL